METKKDIESIMEKMVIQNLSPDNDTFYIHKRHEGKGLFFDGIVILYSYLIPVDNIYLAPSILYNNLN